jgi:hypothetical protein
VPPTRSITCTAAAFVACLALAAPAGAAVRHATPTGTGDCSSGNPCSLATALGGAAANDEVAVHSGSYPVSATVTVSNGIHLHGVYGEPRPYITGDAALTDATVSLDPGTQASYLGIDASGPGATALTLDGATGRDLVVWANDGAITAANVKAHPNGTLLVDALAWTDGPGGEAVHMKDTSAAFGGSATLLAVTAIGTGGANGIATKAVDGTQYVTNTLACGSSDIAAKDGTGIVFVDHSNFRAERSTGLADQGGNSGALPRFRDEAAGDFRPTSGSATIDVGIVDGRSTVDPWGIARGATPDVGAFEYVPGSDPAGGGTSKACSGPAPDPGTGTGSGNPGSGDQPPPAGGDAPAPGPQPTTATPPATHPLPPATPPVFGSTVTLGEVKGAPRVRLPGTGEFVPLTADSTVPVGAVVDATKGTIELTSVRDSSGRTQTGTFWGGVFKVTQSRRDSVTELSLSGGDFSDCKATKRRGRGKLVAAGAKRKRRLWGRDRGGRFRTRGRHGSATVRGTRWLTEDRCDGTYFKVTQGAIDVRDERRRATVRLKRGGSYLAAATPAKRKRSR